MAEIKLPYMLKEGQVAYAAKVMGNFHTILNALNNISLDGVSKTDFQTALEILKAIIDACIKSNQTGNAGQVVFADGSTMQEKLDSGDLNGKDGVTAYADGWVAFEVDNHGHLQVTTSANENAFSVVDGRLIYTIPDAGSAEQVQRYDLGRVVGERGPAGEVTLAQLQSYVNQELAAIAKSSTKYTTALAANWDATDKTNVVSCEGITASNNFLLDATANATEEQIVAWEKAKVKYISQSAREVIIKARGIVPAIDIPLQVTVNI